MKAWLRRDGLILLIFAALVILFYWRILTPNPADRHAFPPGDFYLQFWAFTTFDAAELSAGRLPLWNPYNFAGSPFWADVQAAVFYPPSLLTLLLSAPWGFSAFALELEAIVHFWLAAVFMYLFMRRITASRAAAVIASLTFTFSGYLTGYPSQQLAVLEADVWLPLILLFLYQAVAPGPSSYSIPYLLLAGLAWGLTLMAGHPQSAFIVGCVSLAYLLFLQFTMGSSTHLARFTFQAALLILTGLAVAAIQFIPAVEYTLLSVRAAGTYDQMASGFPVVDVIQLLLPGQVSHYSPLYTGVVGLILAGWVVIAAPNRHTVFWAGLAFAALLIAFGGNTFLYSPLYLTIPGFSIFRGQERWAFAFTFSLAVLAGYGFAVLSNARLTNHPPALWPQLLRFTQFLLLFSLLLVFLFFFGLNQTGWTPDSPFFGLLGAATLLAILLALAWLLWKFAPRWHPVVFYSLTAALVCFDLFSVNWQTNLYPQPPEWHTQMPAAVAAIKNDAAATPQEPFRVYNEFRVYDNYSVPFEIEDLWGASPLRPRRYDQFLAPPMPIERAWELLNVKYVITWRKELYVPSTILYEEPAGNDTTYVHRLTTVGPRAWLVTQAEIADDATMLQKIADPSFDRWQVALLEAESRGQLEFEATSTSPRVLRVSGFTAQPAHLSLQVTTDTSALLILSENYYPGWQATINGQPAPILRAYYTLRAVPVPAGQHTVELTFRPLTVTLGAVISIISLVVVTVSLFVAQKPGVRTTGMDH